MTFDTCFLIDFEREQRRRSPGPAHEFMRRVAESPIYLSAVALGEFAIGIENPASHRLGRIASLFHLLVVDRPIAMRYSRIDRHLRRHGTPIGANDLWIAATAIEHDLPLVTRNVDHFRRVPGLTLLGY